MRRGLLLVPFLLFFFLPLFGMLEYSTRDIIGGGRTGEHWQALFQDPQMSSAIVTQLLLSALTVSLMILLLLPTMIWVRLRVPQMGRVIEFLCLLPLAIPPLVIVVGLRNVYAWVRYLVADSALTLAFIYVVLVLPYAYRALDSALSSINLVTLAEAARSLGASWFTVITRVVVPNVWAGVLAAAFISVALVMGEYTIASLMNFNETLPVVIAFLGKSQSQVSVAASLAALVFAFLLLLLLSLANRARKEARS